MRNQFVKSTTNGNGTVVVRRMTRAEHAASGGLITTAVSRDLIASRAYEIWQHRGQVHGRDKQDWFQAERELRQAIKI